MRRPLFASFLGLVALPVAGQVADDPWFSPCDGPDATCLSARVSEAAALPAASPESTSVRSGHQSLSDAVRRTLAAWESASRSHLPVTDAERLRLRHADPARSGHELNLACELQGPVSAADLARRYTFTQVVESGGTIELIAVPKDDLERLFYDRFVVTLDAATCRPSGLRFGAVITDGGAADGGSIALRPWVDGASGPVRLVGFESPSPATARERPIRTADLSDAPPRLLRDDAPLSLPPAPASFEGGWREPLEAVKPATGDAQSAGASSRPIASASSPSADGLVSSPPIGVSVLTPPTAVK